MSAIEDQDVNPEATKASSAEADYPSRLEVQQFIESGFLRVDKAFPADLAAEARKILWQDLLERTNDPSSWRRPVVRLGMYSQAPFVAAANTPRLHTCFDALVGPNRWLPCRAMGTFPVRFPVAGDPGDIGWHVDASFDYDKPDFMDWRINIFSRGRALLMLFLFSDVSEEDAPTRLRAGSHLDIARAVAGHGDEGLTLRELLPFIEETEGKPEVSSTGPAGTVYLCHPFIVHSAQRHRGSSPRFLAQPPLLPRAPNEFGRSDISAVEQAIKIAMTG